MLPTPTKDTILGPDYSRIKEEIYKDILEDLKTNKLIDPKINDSLNRFDKLLKDADNKYITKNDIESLFEGSTSLNKIKKSLNVLLYDAIDRRGGVPQVPDVDYTPNCR